MAWELVAQGPLANMQLLVANRELTKGTRARLVLELDQWYYAPVFNLAGMEQAFKDRVPPGMFIVDVSGEWFDVSGGRQGYAYIDMEADPAWLAPLVVFIPTFQTILVVGGVITVAIILNSIVREARLFVETVVPPGPARDILGLIVVAGVGLALVIGASKYFGVEKELKGAFRKRQA